MPLPHRTFFSLPPPPVLWFLEGKGDTSHTHTKDHRQSPVAPPNTISRALAHVFSAWRTTGAATATLLPSAALFSQRRPSTAPASFLDTMPAKRKADAVDLDGPVGPAAKRAKPAAKKAAPVHPFFAKGGAASPPPKPSSEGIGGSGDAVDGLWGLMADGNGWKEGLVGEAQKPYFRALAEFLRKEVKAGKEVFPQERDIFSAFNTTPLKDVKVVIIGQDPYHDNNQAHGLCFSVLPGIKTPPSLRNMYTELEQDIEGFKTPSHGYLLSWAQQGVLMINATLTVEAHKANSHEKSGWQTFTDAAIKHIADNTQEVVFLLWGGFAKKKKKLIGTKNKHVVLEAAHPSPLSVTKWRGCKVFSKTNDELKKMKKTAVDWKLPAQAPTVK